MRKWKMELTEPNRRLNMMQILRRCPVIPVIVIERLEDAVPMGQALLAGGISVLEVTLRTACALDAIRLMVDALPQAVIAAGTVRNEHDLQAAAAAGAAFAVSPGLTPNLIAAVKTASIPLLPGVATASEAMIGHDAGFDCLKFFPAEAAGGIALLRGLYGPLPELKFCPTGGIDLAKAADYLALPNVPCVGGSWLVPAQLLRNKDWAGITALAREAAALRQGD
jgi:2-dehydro-3-deoxyphosphogluconate aldolase/(4S)-4-hydroxy-2-oxoglutarate aldolase